jgi:hypothetical protein
MNKDLNVEMYTKNMKVAALSFKMEDFQLMNIISNRIMSDSLFGSSDNFAVFGFFVKQMALNYLNLKPRISESDFLDAKLVGEQYLDTLLSSSEDTDTVKSWADYHEFNIKIRQYSASDIDKSIKEIYGDNPKITENVRYWLIDFLVKDRDMLYDGKNNFLKGLINEFQRVGLTYDYEVRDTVIFSCLVALDRYYEYFVFQHTAGNGVLDTEKVKTTFFPYIDKVKQFSSSSELDYKEATHLLWQLIKSWRESFIYYTELPYKTVQKPIELSKEAKKKLSEAVSKALQKEVKA